MSDLSGIEQLPQPDPRGWLVFDAPLPDELQKAEDATAAADFDRRRFGTVQRPATAAERVLLEHLGYELPDQLTTHVSYKSTSARNRRWPQLESPEES